MSRPCAGTSAPRKPGLPRANGASLQPFDGDLHLPLAAATHTTNSIGRAAKWGGCLSFIVLAMLALASCTSLGPASELPPSLDRARSLDRAGDFAGAARVYEALAAQNTGT